MKNISIRISLLLLLTFILSAAPAKADFFALRIEPLVGYEQTTLVLPTQHTARRLIYGGRATFGVILLSGEVEYTRGTNQETYPTLSQTVTADALKLGIRSGFSLGRLLSFFLRAGGIATQSRYEQTSSGVTTVTTLPVKYSPYAGAGFRASLIGKLALHADVVAVFSDLNNLSNTGYQATAGFTIRLP